MHDRRANVLQPADILNSAGDHSVELVLAEGVDPRSVAVRPQATDEGGQGDVLVAGKALEDARHLERVHDARDEALSAAVIAGPGSNEAVALVLSATEEFERHEGRRPRRASP